MNAGIAAAIGRATGREFRVASRQTAGGGCINQAEILADDGGHRYFIKLNDARHADMFAAEAAGLEELEAAGAIKVPHPIAHGVDGPKAYLVLEWLPLGGRGSGAELGRRLAALHRHTGRSFGWQRDNTLGSTPQPNPPGNDWLAFYAAHRLGYQLDLAARNGIGRRIVESGEALHARLADFFPGYSPPPSLLHGDLWGGNFGYAWGEPVLFDPAVYFGDREADLAMTELFGGFPPEFYAAYREAWPLEPGYATRKTLYNLYHVLNHYNLFGGGYGDQAGTMIDRLLAAVK